MAYFYSLIAIVLHNHHDNDNQENTDTKDEEEQEDPLHTMSEVDLKSETKPFNVLIACTCPLITELALSLQKNATQSHKH